MTQTPLTFEEHLAGIEAAVERMARWSAQAGPDAPVPTCPGWTVHDLLAHQGMVHRWATAIIRGGDARTIDAEAFHGEGREAADPPAWLRAGADDLLDALGTAPEDLETFTFLKQAPPARTFWARRQDHETTVHALDALAARESRWLTADDAWFDDAHAVDGVDELLVGFWQRRSSGPRAAEDPYSALVEAHSGDRWLLDVGADPVRTRRLAPDAPVPDTVAGSLAGSAVDLYLALWNRGGDVSDPAGLVDRWREVGAITW